MSSSTAHVQRPCYRPMGLVGQNTGDSISRTSFLPTTETTDMFTELNNILGFYQDCAPGGKLISIHQDPASDASFLVHHFLSYFLKSGDRVCLLSLAQSFGHYNYVCQKLGLNLKNLKENGKLTFIEGVRLLGNAFMKKSEELDGDNSEYEQIFDSIPGDSSKDCLLPLYRYLANLIKSPAQSDGRTHVIIDYSSVFLSLGVDAKSVLRLIDYLWTLLAGHRGNLVIRGMADDEAEDEDLLSKYLIHKSHVTLMTRGLSSGYCKDVHGQVEITVKDPAKGHPHHSLSTKMQLKILDKNVQFFALGTSAAVL